MCKLPSQIERNPCPGAAQTLHQQVAHSLCTKLTNTDILMKMATPDSHHACIHVVVQSRTSCNANAPDANTETQARDAETQAA